MSARIDIALFALLLGLALAACTKDDVAPAIPVGSCETNPAPGLDCECFNETTGQEQYAAIAGKLDEVAQLNRAEVDTSAMEFNQKDVDEMLALIGDVETDCAAQH